MVAVLWSAVITILVVGVVTGFAAAFALGHHAYDSDKH